MNNARPIDEQQHSNVAEATQLLYRIKSGDELAAEKLMPLVYEQLRAVAGSYFRRQPANHTLQPTALVNEAFMKLVRCSDCDWESRAHFMAVAASAMRQILRDRARRRRTVKHGGSQKQVALEVVEPASPGSSIDILSLDDALTRLESLNERHAQIVKLRFFGGLTVEETAHILEVSKGTVENDWRVIRAWLRSELGDGV